ncbi:hypothetical protein PSAB6_50089 [Paraburkholderia sabiae]|nr:hypothetical protein PSAB6_50089 [Paraburkholderia sabiae]
MRLRGLFGLGVNGDWIARRKGLSERFVELFLQGHWRFLRLEFRLPDIDTTSLCHMALHKGTSGISLSHQRCAHAITSLKAEIVTSIPQNKKHGMTTFGIDVTDPSFGLARDRRVREAGDARHRGSRVLDRTVPDNLLAKA